MSEAFKREVSCFLVPGQEIISVTTNNSAGGVEFDFFTIWEALKVLKYESVCMIHTHPSGFPMMSGTDWNMVYGWVQAIGKPIFFVIITDTDTTCYLCQRAAEDKNKINREIIEFEPNDNFRYLSNVIYYLSCVSDVEALSENIFEQMVEEIRNHFNGANIYVKNVEVKSHV